MTWDDPRIIVGLDLFPSFLAADKDISKKINDDNKLLLLLVYHKKKNKAEKMAEHLRELTSIRNIAINVKIVKVTELDFIDNISPAGIFLTEPLYNKLPGIVSLGIREGIVVFSPYKGDVEEGILCGIFIGEKILPYINKKIMKKSKIRFKSFFLRISKFYD